MPPDLNSLPASKPSPSSGSPLSQHQQQRRMSINTGEHGRASPPSPRSPSLSSLHAAASINAGLHRSPGHASPGLERRRSSLMNNLTNINHPGVPSPGEMQSSHGNHTGGSRTGRSEHHRQPSLGELHQELENEQEAQVNRLLHMIRLQQDQLATLQQRQQNPQDSLPGSSEHPQPATPASPLATSGTMAITEQSSPRSISASHSQQHHFNRPHSLSRQSSARISNPGNSRGNSPALRPQSSSLGPLTEDFLLGGTRDECSFYQAETQMLTRENQMLKLRIRELERQVSEMSVGAAAGSPSANVPPMHSPLASPPTTLPSAVSPSAAAEVEAIKTD